MDTMLLSWMPSESFILRAGLDLRGDLYHARTDASAGKEEFDVRVQEIRLGVRGYYLLPSGLSLSLRTGVVIGGRYEIEAPAGTEEGRVKPGPFVEAGIAFKF